MLRLAGPHLCTTARLRLRAFRETDRAAYARYHSRPDVYRYLYREPPVGEALQRRFLRAVTAPFAAQDDVLRRAAERREDGVLVGEVSLRIASAAALQGEIGYVFDPEFAGRGYATEAVRAMLSLAFAEIGFHRVFARLDSRNEASIRLVERLGLRREAHFRENDRRDGVWGDEYVYAIRAAEWA